MICWMIRAVLGLLILTHAHAHTHTLSYSRLYLFLENVEAILSGKPKMREVMLAIVKELSV